MGSGCLAEEGGVEEWGDGLRMVMVCGFQYMASIHEGLETGSVVHFLLLVSYIINYRTDFTHRLLYVQTTASAGKGIRARGLSLDRFMICKTASKGSSDCDWNSTERRI